MDGAWISDMEGLVLSAQLVLSVCGLGSVPAFEPDPHHAQGVSVGGARVPKAARVLSEGLSKGRYQL